MPKDRTYSSRASRARVSRLNREAGKMRRQAQDCRARAEAPNSVASGAAYRWLAEAYDLLAAGYESDAEAEREAAERAYWREVERREARDEARRSHAAERRMGA